MFLLFFVSVSLIRVAQLCKIASTFITAHSNLCWLISVPSKFKKYKNKNHTVNTARYLKVCDIARAEKVNS